MTNQTGNPSSDNIPCAELGGIFLLCRNRQIQPEKMFKDSEVPLQQLLDETAHISWAQLTDILAITSRYFDEQDLRQAGRDSWQFGELSGQGSIGRILLDTKDQYLAIYGAIGYCTTRFPVECRIEQSTTKSMTIRLHLTEQVRSSYPFYLFIAGQMEALPRPLGLGFSDVSLQATDRSATYVVNFPDEKYFHQLISKSTSRLHASKTIARYFLISKITQRQQAQAHQTLQMDLELAEQKIRQLEDQLYSVNQLNNRACWLVNRKLEITETDDSIKDLLGYQAGEFSGSNLLDHMSLFDFQYLSRSMTKLLGNPEKIPHLAAVQAMPLINIQLTHKNGQQVWTSFQLYQSNRSSNEAHCEVHQIDLPNSLESKIDHQLIDHKLIVDNSPEATFTLDKDNVITFANMACSRMFGYSVDELLGQSIRMILPESLNDPMLRELNQSETAKRSITALLKGIRKDHLLIPCEATIASYNISGRLLKTYVLRDIAERSEAKRERQSLASQLLSSQKVESLGQLSGGIAHDFSNLLVAIDGYADLANESGVTTEQEYFLGEIKRASRRGFDMTQKLLNFTRRQNTPFQLVEVNELVQGIHDIIRRLLPQNVSIRVDGTSGHLMIAADPTQIEQILINLAINARDAMPGGGELFLGVSVSKSATDLPHVIISVKDTGTGMDHAVQQRMFEPLFTTKPEGSGTGLGLAVVYSIIQSHGGHVEIDSTLGIGTEIRVRLPKVDPATQPKTAAAKRKRNNNDRQNEAAGETLLIIEDDPQVRTLAKLALVAVGYTVIDASNGRDALGIFSDLANEIDLVLMDVVMPGMSGKNTARALRPIRADVPIVFMSGYSADSAQTKFIVDNRLPLIQKPSGIIELREAVRDFLDQTTNSLAAQNGSARP